MTASRFVAGRVYDRQEVHRAAAAENLPPGNNTAGIVYVGHELCVFWNPYRRFYANAWIDEPTEFTYSGEGSVGAMQQTAGNKYLLDAEMAGNAVVVWYKIARQGSRWKCLGQYDIVGHEAGVSVDAQGEPRPDIRFRFVAQAPGGVGPLPPIVKAPAPPLPDEDALWDAVSGVVEANGGRRRRGPSSSLNRRQSNPLLTMYVQRRAIQFGGLCESCLEAPGWTDDAGLPHFQAHHIEPDVDLVDWIGALCGTCHDRMHHGSDREQRGKLLRETVKQRQQQLGRQTYELDGLPKTVGP